jgi:class 3 adenylate cyclase
MRPIAITAALQLRAPPADVWRFVSDTDRTNRVIGSRPVEYTPVEESSPTSARFVGHTSAGGLDLTYEELPFEWTQGRELRVERRMRGGLLESYALVWSLEPKGEGTYVTVRLELVPRYSILRPFVWLEGRGVVGRLVAFAASIDAHVSARGPSPFAPQRAAVNEALLGDRVAQLVRDGVRPALASRIAAHVREAADPDLVRIRPFELADGMKEERREVLCAMLHAVPAGLFDLRWAIVCPSCNTASELAASLEEVKPEGHCQLCDISFDLDLDRAVEATFVPHESVRKVDNQMFCIGGPARTPHVWSQANVLPGRARSLEAPHEPGRYRLFARGGAVSSLEVAEGAPGEVSLTVTDGGVRPAEARVAPLGSVSVTNATREPRHMKVERLGYANDAATAHYLSTVDDFRRLFSRDLLKRGTALKVMRVVIFFSDLTGSTALYTSVGDAAAFRLVDDHFDVLREAITKNGGVIVKTMGDAVMAAFRDPAECIRASVASLRAFESFRASHEHGAKVGLKLGAFDGPCYVVTANGALDYFGQTVNVASRVQHLASSGEIIVPSTMLASLSEDDRRTFHLSAPFEASVKGVEGSLSLVRLTLPAT